MADRCDAGCFGHPRRHGPGHAVHRRPHVGKVQTSLASIHLVEEETILKTSVRGVCRAFVVTSLLALVLATIALGGCRKEAVKIGATSVPHAEILEFAKPLLEKEGIEIDIVEFNDYVQPNIQLADKQLAANFFQHIPYLEDFSAERNLDLTWIAKIHIEPMGIYAGKVKKLEDLKDGDQVGIPNDVTNAGRALALLEKAGLLKFKDGVGVKASVLDVEENPRNLRIVELNAEILPHSLADLAVAVINGNFAIQANLSPLNDALFIEDSDSPFANVLAVRTADKDDKVLKRIAEVLTSEEVRGFILEKYKGGVVPAF
ncbi:MAG: MetQ/NlpA family ABC transporter substrate-binding protein [Firmicutes bacterium]|nr:MetQ/NlpA family ABC transporter substrate-binding protein [Candidatus Fermentithermobacillaceae bacterium]